MMVKIRKNLKYELKLTGLSFEDFDFWKSMYNVSLIYLLNSCVKNALSNAFCFIQIASK